MLLQEIYQEMYPVFFGQPPLLHTMNQRGYRGCFLCFNGLEYFAFAFWAIGDFVLINIVFHLRLKSSKYDCLQEEKGVIQFYSEIYVPDDEDNSV